MRNISQPSPVDQGQPEEIGQRNRYSAIALSPRPSCLFWLPHWIVQFEPLPALVIFVLQYFRLESEASRTDDQTRLKHEGQRILYVVGGEVSRRRSAVRFGVGAVAGHAVVQTGAAREESFRFGVVFTMDEPHKFVHHVAMKPGGRKCVLSYQSTGGENDEVDIGSTSNMRRSSQDCED